MSNGPFSRRVERIVSQSAEVENPFELAYITARVRFKIGLLRREPKHPREFVPEDHPEPVTFSVQAVAALNRQAESLTFMVLHMGPILDQPIRRGRPA